ncbi:MAG: YdiY family protein [Halioglobus sp.]
MFTKERMNNLLLGFMLALGMVGMIGTSLVSTAAQAQEVSEPEAPPLDEVLLKNGSRILGTVTSARDGVIVIETDFAGSLSIALDSIASMRAQAAQVFQLADGTVIRDQPLVVEDESLQVSTDSGEPLNYALGDVLVLNPEPWELGEGYKPFGTVSFAYAMQKGNTETEDLDFKVESFWRSLRDRYTLKADASIDETNDEKTGENWRVSGKYDYFLEGNDYWGWILAAEQDEFADLDLRVYTGPYYGRQFYNEPILTLSGEVGITYVTEDFIVAEDQDYLGALWDFHASSDYLGGDSILYVDHVGIWNLEQTDNLVLNTSFGLAFPLMGALEAAAELVLDYDSSVGEGVDKLDQIYRLRIGYTW